MDSMSVSIAGGIQTKHSTVKNSFKIAIIFALAQAIMPLLGWGLGSLFVEHIERYGPIIGFIVLVIIGGKMLYESQKNEKYEDRDILNVKTLLLLAFATSIDAFFIGITIPLLEIPLVLSTIVIGVITFVLSFIGYEFGKKISTMFSKHVETLGGLILICIGIKILLEGLLV